MAKKPNLQQSYHRIEMDKPTDAVDWLLANEYYRQRLDGCLSVDISSYQKRMTAMLLSMQLYAEAFSQEILGL